MAVIKACFEVLSGLPRWFRTTFPNPTFVHIDCYDKFEAIEDPKRFAGGWAWKCRRCGSIACSREEFASKHGAWVVASIFCRECWQRFRVENLEPMWERILEDWDGGSADAGAEEAKV